MLALVGEAIFFGSTIILIYTLIVFCSHPGMVVFYEKTNFEAEVRKVV